MTDAPSRKRALRDLFVTTLGVSAVCVVAGRLRGVPFGSDLAPTLLAAAFLFTALEKARRDEGGAARFGISLGGLLSPREEGGASWGLATRAAIRELGVAVAVAAITFVPYGLAYAAIHAPGRSFSLEQVALPASFIAGQVIVVALPEEAFFRGFVQTRLVDAFPARQRLFGLHVSIPALVTQAALFAWVHVLVDPNPARLAVFFPGLLFGLLREWRGGIGAALIYHALCNVFAEVLFQGLS